MEEMSEKQKRKKEKKKRRLEKIIERGQTPEVIIRNDLPNSSKENIHNYTSFCSDCVYGNLLLDVVGVRRDEEGNILGPDPVLTLNPRDTCNSNQLFLSSVKLVSKINGRFEWHSAWR